MLATVFGPRVTAEGIPWIVAAMVVGAATGLDPAGVLNPGKLGLPSRFGADPWPPR